MNHKTLTLRIAAMNVVLLAISAMPAPAQTKRIKPAADHVIIKCRSLVNPASGTTIPNAVIEINGGRVLRVGTAESVPVPEGMKVLDFSDKYIIPGLIDTHGHLYGGINVRLTTAFWIPPLYLAAGVTTVRAPGSMDPGGDLAMRERISKGLLPGPRYYIGGEYVEMAPVTVAWMNPVSTAEEARLKVDQLAAAGYDAIKLYARMSGDVMQATIEAAHEHGLKAIAHIGAVTYKQAIEMGIDELFHGISTMRDGLPPVDPADREASMRARLERDLTVPEVQEVFRLAADHRVVLTPTAVVAETLLPGAREIHYMEEQKKYYSPDAWATVEQIANGEKGRFSPSNPETAKKSVAKNLEFIRRANAAGVILATGTDLVVPTVLPGWSLWREMDLFAEAGLKPMEILKAATINGAFALGHSDVLGTIEPGKAADMVVLNSDPLQKISNVRSVHRVIKGGVVYDPAELRKPLEGKVL